MSAEDPTHAARAAAKRLADQAFHTAGDAEGRARVLEDRETILDALQSVRYSAQHRLEGTACSCGEWEAKLGESIHRGFDQHLLAPDTETGAPSYKCARCGERLAAHRSVQPGWFACQDGVDVPWSAFSISPGGGDA